MIRDKIWYELVDAKYGEIYLAYYINRCKNVKKTFRIVTLVFSAGGVFGWKIWEPIALIACVIIAGIQLLNLIENQIVASDDELIKIGELRSLYLKYFNKLERLWTDFEGGTVRDEDASSQFFALRKGLKEKIEKLDNELHIKQIESLLLKTDKQEKLYFNNRYGKGQ
jgi:hypothetical protein